MKLTQYRVLVDQGADESTAKLEPVEELVTVIHGDQLRAELEAGKHRLPALGDAPQHHTSLWLWCALTREKRLDVKFQEWLPRVLKVEVVKDPDDPNEEGSADPTRPEGSSVELSP